MKHLFLSILFLVSLGFNPLFAETITVSGDVSGTWSADTVLVVGEVRVPTDSTLTIEPGVKVIFQGHYKMIVDTMATLFAVGTEQDSILFTAEVGTNKKWHGIRFTYSSDMNQLAYCVIERGKATGGNSDPDADGGGIYCENAVLAIDHCTIRHNSASYHYGGDGGGIYCSGSSLTMDHCYIAYNYALGLGALGGGIRCQDSAGIIKNCIIKYNRAGSSNTGAGGGIYLSSCLNITIYNCAIFENTSYGNGGGILCCINSEPDIEHNIIYDNFAGLSGGGIRCGDSDPYIYSNIICGNAANSQGGGIYFLSDSNPEISHNIICKNSAGDSGGGICCGSSTNRAIHYNVIGENTARTYGGGINCGNSSFDFNYNTIFRNCSSIQGGGIHGQLYSSPTIWGNTVFGNGTVGSCGGLYCTATPVLINSILWLNLNNQIVGSPQVTYSNVMGGWPGIGNINEDPMFVNTELNDYRLLWGSPCIDSGDPDPQYNDPDGTRADMGAFYFDQSMPVRILLSPYEIPYLIAPEGGTMDYTIQATNIYQSSHQVTIWCDVTLPDSTVYGPVLGPVTLTIEPSQTVERIRTQTIPAAAPMGVYHYNAYAVVDQDTSKDSFMFGKLGTIAGGIGGWGNAGEPFEEFICKGVAGYAPAEYTLFAPYPNPFNPTTTISFSLPQSCFVKLEIFDVTGRNVGAHRDAPLIDGWRESGKHQVTFDASSLASGIYIYRLEAGQFSDSGKMVLMK